MTNSHTSITDRRGVAQCEQEFLKLGWLFREQPVLDFGIDAIIEYGGKGYPTGKLIAVQIKSGDSFLKKDSKGDIVFYVDKVHEEYWLNFHLPVILVICDVNNNKTYWKQVCRRNLSKAGKQSKLTLNDNDSLSYQSNKELVSIADSFQMQSDIKAEIDNMQFEDSVLYATELTRECSDTLADVRKAMDRFNVSNKTRIAKMEQLLQSASSKALSKKQIEKELTKIEKPFSVSVRILNQKLSSDSNKIVIEGHVAFVLVLDYIVEKYPMVKEDILRFLDSENKSVKSIASMCVTYSDLCKNPKCQTADLKRLFYNSSFIFLDYREMLLEISEILDKEIYKIRTLN
mgnify:FL=1